MRWALLALGGCAGAVPVLPPCETAPLVALARDLEGVGDRQAAVAQAVLQACPAAIPAGLAGAIRGEVARDDLERAWDLACTGLPADAALHPPAPRVAEVRALYAGCDLGALGLFDARTLASLDAPPLVPVVAFEWLRRVGVEADDANALALALGGGRRVSVDPDILPFTAAAWDWTPDRVDTLVAGRDGHRLASGGAVGLGVDEVGAVSRALQPLPETDGDGAPPQPESMPRIPATLAIEAPRDLPIGALAEAMFAATEAGADRFDWASVTVDPTDPAHRSDQVVIRSTWLESPSLPAWPDGSRAVVWLRPEGAWISVRRPGPLRARPDGGGRLAPEPGCPPDGPTVCWDGAGLGPELERFARGEVSLDGIRGRIAWDRLQTAVRRALSQADLERVDLVVAADLPVQVALEAVDGLARPSDGGPAFARVYMVPERRLEAAIRHKPR